MTLHRSSYPPLKSLFLFLPCISSASHPSFHISSWFSHQIQILMPELWVYQCSSIPWDQCSVWKVTDVVLSSSVESSWLTDYFFGLQNVSKTQQFCCFSVPYPKLFTLQPQKATKSHTWEAETGNLLVFSLGKQLAIVDCCYSVIQSAVVLEECI